MPENKSNWFRKSSRNVDDEFLLVQRPRKNHRGVIPKPSRVEAEARDDRSISSVEESAMDTYSLSDDETKGDDDDKMLVPVVKLVDSFNSWIFNENENDNHSGSSVNDGSCTSNDEDSCESGSCTSSQGQFSASSSRCSSVDNSTLDWSQTSSVKNAHTNLWTIQKKADSNTQGRPTKDLDEASFATSVSGSTWGTDILAEENRRVKNTVVDFDKVRIESTSALGSYISDGEENDDTLWEDVESLHNRDHTKESSCVGNDTANAIRNILKDFRESSCMEPKIEEGPRSGQGHEAVSYISLSRPQSKILATSVPESIMAKSPKKGDTMQLDGVKVQQPETVRLPSFSSFALGRPRSINAETSLASQQPDHLGGNHAPTVEKATAHQDTSKVKDHLQRTEASTSANLQDARTNKNEPSTANEEIDSNGPAMNNDTKKHSRTKRLVASLHRARLTWKGKFSKRMGAKSLSRKVKRTLGKENNVKPETSNVSYATNSRDEEVGTLYSEGNRVSRTDSLEHKTKNYSCLGDRFMFLINGCAPTKLEQVQHAPSSVAECGRYPMQSSYSYDDSCDDSYDNSYDDSYDDTIDNPTVVVEEDGTTKDDAAVETMVLNSMSRAGPWASERGVVVPQEGRKKKLVASVASLSRRLQQVPTRWGNSSRRGENEAEKLENDDDDTDTTNNNKDTSRQLDLEVASRDVGSKAQESIERGESLLLEDDLDYSDSCIEKSLEDYQNDTAARWRPFEATFTKYPWNGLVVFSRKPSGLVDPEGPVNGGVGEVVVPTESMYESTPDIETGLAQRSEWAMGEISENDLECRQGIEAVIHTKSWKYLERLHDVQIIASDDSPDTTVPKESNIKSLMRWSKNLLHEGPMPKSVATTPSPRTKKVDQWERYVSARGKHPQVFMIHTRNLNTQEISTKARLCMKNARCHLRGIPM